LGVVECVWDLLVGVFLVVVGIRFGNGCDY